MSKFAGFTPGPIRVQKCPCGHPACNQYTLSTQGTVGFIKSDARLYAAAPDLLRQRDAAAALLRETTKWLENTGAFWADCNHEDLLARIDELLKEVEG